MKKALRRKLPQIPDDYFLTNDDSDGGLARGTLPVLLGEMLGVAEEMFGPHNITYTLLGIEFSPSGPCVWIQRDRKYMTIQLGSEVLSDYQDACCQLAHECIHFLYQDDKKHANVLEEGIAVYFQRHYMRLLFNSGWWDGEIAIETYREALRLTEQLLDIQPNAVKLLRAHEPNIARISQDLILGVCPTVPNELAIRLAEPFC